VRLFNIKCPGCRWQSPLPVDERVARIFKEKKYCVHCRKERNEDVPYIIRETKVTGPTSYFPPKD
jgi:hypothetical protein